MPPEPPRRSHGKFPEPRTGLFETKYVRVAVAAVAQARATGTIAALYGESGTGKTAAAAVACAQAGGEWVYVQAPFKSTTKDFIASCYSAVFGQPPTGTARQASTQLAHALHDAGLGLCIDECHYTGLAGIQAIRYIHDDIATTYGHRMPIVLIGAGLEPVLSSAGGEMIRRCPWRASFHALSTDEVIEILPTVNPILAATSRDLIAIIDSRYAKGLVGRWANVSMAAAGLTDGGVLNLKGIARSGGLTAQGVSDVLFALGVTQ